MNFGDDMIKSGERFERNLRLFPASGFIGGGMGFVAFQFSPSMVVLTAIASGVIGVLTWEFAEWFDRRHADARTNLRENSEWVAGYKAAKFGPKNGAPIGGGALSEHYLAGVRDANETAAFVNLMRGESER